MKIPTLKIPSENVISPIVNEEIVKGFKVIKLSVDTRGKFKKE